MLRIEEIVGAVDDDFRDYLDEKDTHSLQVLAHNRAALNHLRPVGVSYREALATVTLLLQRRDQHPHPHAPEHSHKPVHPHPDVSPKRKPTRARKPKIAVKDAGAS
jgi:hypothetical protein